MKFTDITFTPDGAENCAAQVKMVPLGQPLTAPVAGTYHIDGEQVRLEAGQVVTPVGELQRLRNLEECFKKTNENSADWARSYRGLWDQVEELKAEVARLKEFEFKYNSCSK